MDLKSCIEKIIKKEFSKGDIFDSHTVINLLFTSEEYLLAYLQGYDKEKSIALYHSKIAEMIKDVDGVEKFKSDDGKELEAKTLTIFGKVSKNKLWRKK